jgi:hypothetical protein
MSEHTARGLVLAAASLPRTWHAQRTALLVDVTLDNVWHALFHALPTHERVHREKLHVASLHLWPRYTKKWPADARVANWAGWQLCVRTRTGRATPPTPHTHTRCTHSPPISSNLLIALACVR